MNAFPSRCLRWLILPVALAVGSAQAFVVSINQDRNSQSLYLRVGDGVDPGQSGGSVNAVTVTVPAATLGAKTPVPQAMTGSGRLISDYDGYALCNAGQVYIGGYFRGRNNAGSAVLSAAVTRQLTNASGGTLPFSQISWTTSGNGPDGEINGQPIGGGSFAGGVQTLASFPVNTWQETCFSFVYANSLLPAAGTYTGTVTYTLASP